MDRPPTAAQAWDVIARLLGSPLVWVPPAGERTSRILGELIVRHGVTANVVPDAQLAALAIEHGLTVVSADSDSARFREVRWVNPLA